jgi:DNA-binding MurR/RpiR family transcriptional regulator
MQTLSESELYLWHFIQVHLDKIADYSIIKLSEEAMVSPATITRTLKKQGYDGFSAFKHHLRTTRQTNIQPHVIDNVDTKIRRAILKNEHEVIQTINMIDYQQFEQVIQQIHRAEKIVIFARGLTEYTAQEAQIKLQLLGKYTEIYTDPNIITIVSSRMVKNQVAIFLSLNGETEELVKAAKNAKHAQIKTITFTTNGHSRLAKLSDITILGYKSQLSSINDYEVHSRLPLEILVRILIDAYAITFVSQDN